MEDFTFQSPSTPPPVNLASKSKILKILLILLPILIISAVAVFIYIKHPFNLFQSKKTITINLVEFTGKVTEKGKDYLLLERGGKTVKIIIDNETKVELLIMSKLSQNSSNSSNLSKNSSFAEIKIGLNVGALGEGSEEVVNAKKITIFQ